MKFKLRPKGLSFCPGCPKKDLQLITEPKFNIVPEKKQDTKRVTIIGSKKETRHFGLF
jgi:hypothetical protein